MFGYDAIPATPGAATERLAPTTETRIEPDRLADLLVGRGYTEAITYSFVDPELDARGQSGQRHVRLTNPIASDMAVLRQLAVAGVAPGRHDITSVTSAAECGCSSSGRSSPPREDACAQSAVLAGLSLGSRSPEHWDGASADVGLFRREGRRRSVAVRHWVRSRLYDSKPATHPALSPGRTAQIMRDGNAVGWLGVAASGVATARRQETVGRRVRAAARCDFRGKRVLHSRTTRDFRRSGEISRSSSTSRLAANALIESGPRRGRESAPKYRGFRRIPRQAGRFKAKKHRV